MKLNVKRAEKKEIAIIGTIGCLLGILCFVLLYGVKVLDFTYDAWLLNTDIDLSQHYVGWCHYRNTPFRFPIGLIDSLSVPYSMSVDYTDSIPLLAFIFKLFRGVLPVHFQYFGFYGLICFALQGMFSAILIRRFTDKRFISIFGSLFFILSVPMIQRMFYHTALASQWLLIIFMIIWFSYDFNKNIRRNVIVFGLLGFLCVGIHSYYVFMCGIVLMLAVTDNIISSKKCGIDRNIYIKSGLYSVLSFIVFSFINLYILGGFYGESSVSGGGFGVFNANLNAFINPYIYGGILPKLNLYNAFQYEGAAYLGSGTFILIIACCVSYFYTKALLNKSGSDPVAGHNTNILKIIKIYCKNHHRRALIIAGIIFSFLIAVFPNFDFNDIKIIHIPLPAIINKILGICRTNGRFVWIAMYLIMLSAIVLFAKQYENNMLKIIFALAVIIQVYDISGFAKAKGEYFKTEQEINSVWTEFEQFNLTDNRKQFAFMYNDSDIMMDTAFYGYLNDLSQNCFYYARPIDEAISESIKENEKEILSHNINSEKIYIFRDSDLTDEMKSALDAVNAKEYYFEGHSIFVK